MSLKQWSRNQHFGKTMFYLWISVVLENDRMIQDYFSATILTVHTRNVPLFFPQVLGPEYENITSK